MAHFNPVNFSQIVESGIWGVIHKARQGLGYGDPKYVSRMAAAKAAGLLWGAYDFSTHDDVNENVTSFLAYANLGKADLAVLDFEDDRASNMTGDQAYAFLLIVSQKLARPCAIYGGNRIREQINPKDPKWISAARDIPLWQCRYTKGQPVDNAALFDEISPIPPWEKNFLIQYTGDGVGPAPHTVSGLQNGADLNAFLGTKEELAAIWAGGSGGQNA